MAVWSSTPAYFVKTRYPAASILLVTALELRCSINSPWQHI